MKLYFFTGHKILNWQDKTVYMHTNS